MNAINAITELTGYRPQTIDDAVLSSTEPLVLRALVTDWPIVEAGRQSPQSAADYILQFYSGDPVDMLQLLPDGSTKVVALGSEIDRGMFPQLVVNV